MSVFLFHRRTACTQVRKCCHPGHDGGSHKSGLRGAASGAAVARAAVPPAACAATVALRASSSRHSPVTAPGEWAEPEGSQALHQPRSHPCQ
eukprot:7878827-Lingulodinium_polyedra.AAC.2